MGIETLKLSAGFMDDATRSEDAIETYRAQLEESLQAYLLPKHRGFCREFTDHIHVSIIPGESGRVGFRIQLPSIEEAAGWHFSSEILEEIDPIFYKLNRDLDKLGYQVGALTKGTGLTKYGYHCISMEISAPSLPQLKTAIEKLAPELVFKEGAKLEAEGILEQYRKNLDHLRGLRDTINERLNEQLARKHPELAGKEVLHFGVTPPATNDYGKNLAFILHVVVLKDHETEITANPTYMETITSLMQKLLDTDLLKELAKGNALTRDLRTDPVGWPEKKQGMPKRIRFPVESPVRGLEAINSMLDPDLRLREEVVRFTPDISTQKAAMIGGGGP